MQSSNRVTSSLPAWGLKGRLAAMALGVALFAGVACGGDSNGADALDDPNATGGELADRFIVLLQDKDVDGLNDFLSDAFIIQRANGLFMDKETYLGDLPEIRDYTISDVLAQQSDSTLIVRWSLAVDQEIDGAQYAQDPAPRLSTFVYHDGEWQLAAHANFNIPEGGTPPASPTN